MKLKLKQGVPMTRKTPAARNSKIVKTPSRGAARTNSPGPLRRLFSHRSAKPVLFALGFMGIGALTMYFVSAATTSYSIWGGSAVPRTLAVSDATAKELGVQFQAKVAGYVTGVRFYKGAQNTGVHTGSLWDNKGNLLASVQFSNETSSGWQTASFAKPVSVAANVTYVISYFAPNGHYSLNAHYFANQPHSTKTLVALQNTASSPNGVYASAPSPGTFPSQSGGGANYWVDVVFNTKLLNPQPAPAAPTGLTATVQSDNSVTLNWQASSSANTITQYTVYRNGNQLATTLGTAFAYTDTTAQAGSTYSYQVQATDSTGATSVLSDPVSVTVSSSSQGGSSTGSTTTCPLPKYPDATCAGVPSDTALSAYAGPTDITTANTVIDAQNITSCLTISAPGVVIKRSHISATGCADVVLNNAGSKYHGGYSGTGLIIQDSEIDCRDTNGTALGDNNLTALRNNIHGCENGFDMDLNADIEDNYIHDLFQSSAAHTDGLQSYDGSGVKLIHNTFYGDTPLCSNANYCAGTSAVNVNNIAANGVHTSNLTIKDNMLAGGAFSLYCPTLSTTNFIIQNNHFSYKFRDPNSTVSYGAGVPAPWKPDTGPGVGDYGPNTDCNDGATISGNVYHETGLPVPF
jgi:hypothetical protein